MRVSISKRNKTNKQNWRAGDLRRETGVPERDSMHRGPSGKVGLFRSIIRQNLLSTQYESHLCWLLGTKEEEDTVPVLEVHSPTEETDTHMVVTESEKNNHTGITR